MVGENFDDAVGEGWVCFRRDGVAHVLLVEDEQDTDGGIVIGVVGVVGQLLDELEQVDDEGVVDGGCGSNGLEWDKGERRARERLTQVVEG